MRSVTGSASSAHREGSVPVLPVPAWLSDGLRRRWGLLGLSLRTHTLSLMARALGWLTPTVQQFLRHPSPNGG